MSERRAREDAVRDDANDAREVVSGCADTDGGHLDPCECEPMTRKEWCDIHLWAEHDDEGYCLDCGDLTPGMVRCPRCGGTGSTYWPEDCGLCSGEGETTPEAIAWEEASRAR